jgi:hypothetical protein
MTLPAGRHRKIHRSISSIKTSRLLCKRLFSWQNFSAGPKPHLLTFSCLIESKPGATDNFIDDQEVKMGHAAKAAFDDLHRHLSGNMHACVLVKDTDHNQYYRNNIFNDGFYSTYDAHSSTGHVEVELFQKLYGYFGNFSNIPNNSTIIFAAKWSPCTQCTAQDIPNFLAALDIQNRNIRVKFRFENYYSLTDWPHNNLHRWTDNATAQQAYDLLSTQYPCLWQPESSFEVGNNLKVLRERGKRHLVFAPISQAVTSVTEDSLPF